MKPTRKRVATPATFKLPSLAAFKRLSLPRRSRVFLDWMRTKRQDETINMGFCQDCALGQFAQAMGLSTSNPSATHVMSLGVDYVQVLPVGKHGDTSVLLGIATGNVAWRRLVAGVAKSLSPLGA